MTALPAPLNGTEHLPDLVDRALRAAVGPLRTLVCSHPDVSHPWAGTWASAIGGGSFQWSDPKRGYVSNKGMRDHDRDPHLLLKWIDRTWTAPSSPWKDILALHADQGSVQQLLSLRNKHAHNSYAPAAEPLDASGVYSALAALTAILHALGADDEKAYVRTIEAEAKRRADLMTKRKQWQGLRLDRPSRQPHTVGLHWTEPNPETLTPEQWWLVHIDREGEAHGLSHPRSTDGVVRYLNGFKRDDEQVIVGCAFCFSVPRWLADAQASTSGNQGFEAVWDACADVTNSAQPVGDIIAALNDRLGVGDGPFWRGDVNEPDPNSRTRGRETKRRTEKHVAQQTDAEPSSIFQVGGDASVGALAIHGMPVLSHLKMDGFRIWPFEEPGRQTIVEIFPRALWASTQHGSPVRSRPTDRAAFLDQRGYGRGAGALETLLRERRAFDALMTAWALREFGGNLERSPWGTGESAIEGEIWLPTPTGERNGNP